LSSASIECDTAMFDIQGRTANMGYANTIDRGLDGYDLDKSMTWRCEPIVPSYVLPESDEKEI
jgi:hypothetical protein